MKNVYVVQVERIIKKNTVSKKGAVFVHERKVNSYLCMINAYAKDPTIMYTEDVRSAIYYTSDEIKHVRRYLLDNNFTFTVTDVTEKPIVNHSTQITRKRNSLIEFI